MCIGRTSRPGPGPGGMSPSWECRALDSYETLRLRLQSTATLGAVRALAYLRVCEIDCVCLSERERKREGSPERARARETERVREGGREEGRKGERARGE